MDHVHRKLIGLDVFSGIGGISEALSEWVRPIAYCENDRFAQGVLLSRMAKGQLPRAPIWDDITTLRGSMLPAVDIIYGGFPCQDISVAGRRVGLDGERSGLVREVWRLADELRPRFIFLENVPAIVNGGLDRILGALAERGYDARWLCLSAAELGACHRRDRWWLLAHSNTRRQLQPSGIVSEVGRRASNGGAENAPHTVGEWIARTSNPQVTHHTVKGLAQRKQELSQSSTTTEQPQRCFGWPTVAPICGADARLPNRSNRIAALGNSVNVVQAREAFRRLIGGE